MNRKPAFLFWPLNVLGWASFAAVYETLFRSDADVIGMPAAVAASAALGTAVSACLRGFYRRVLKKRVAVVVLVILIAAASLAGAMVWWGKVFLIHFVLIRESASAGEIGRDFLRDLVFYGVPLLGWSFLYVAGRYALSWKSEQTRLAGALALARSAQLRMLRDQLNPHFLFNALNSIRTLIDEDAVKARQMTGELSEFLRYASDREGPESVPLRTELEAVEHYFAIQKKRYEDKLDVRVSAEPAALDLPILGFLLHPLVENAVKYGMMTSPLPLRIEIEARAEDGRLIITAANTGRWVPPAVNGGADGPGTQTGLDNLRLRLENSDPGRHTLHISEQDGWVRVRLELAVRPGRSR